MTGYRTIVVDPPWPYRVHDRTKAEARRHYPLMSLVELAKLDVGSYAHEDGAALWLWTTNRFVVAAHQLAVEWDFQPVTMITWCKTGQPGVGHRVRSNTEHCLLATRGKLSTPTEPLMSSWYVWPRHRVGRRSHSYKPPAFFSLVEKATPGPWLEMFGRQCRLGWDTWDPNPFPEQAAG